MASGKDMKLKRFSNIEEYKNSQTPKAYTPALQPLGYRVELVNWGNGDSIAISKFIGNKFTTITIRLDRINDIIEAINNILKKL